MEPHFLGKNVPSAVFDGGRLMSLAEKISCRAPNPGSATPAFFGSDVGSADAADN